MNRELRDRTYVRHSQHTRTEAMHDIVGGKAATLEGLAQALLLALFQDSIARYHYFDTFIPSRDPRAFFEYVYHRVSSIRYLTRLVLALEVGCRRGAPPGWADVYAKLTAVCRKPFDLTATEVFQEEAADNPRKLIDALNGRRVREVASLRLAWSFAARELQTRVPAEQLTSWCRWLILDDLPKFETAFYPRAAPVIRYPDIYQTCALLDAQVAPEIALLRRDLYSLWAQCHRERTDLAGAVGVSFDYIRAALPAPDPNRPDWTGLKEVVAGIKDQLRAPELRPVQSAPADLAARPTDDPTRSAVAGALAAALPDFARARVGELFAALADGMKAVLAPVDHDTARHVLAALVDVVECFARAPGRKAEDGAETAMWETMGQAAQQVDRGLHLRVILLRAQARLPAPDTDQAAPAATSDQALNLANDGLIATRRLDQLDRGIGASAPYFHYRSLLLLTRGTARWAGRDDADADKFRKAYQDYERARGTIEPAPDRTLAAQIDLHATACALAHGDWYLREDEHGVADGPLLSRSNAKYLIAKGYLRRAFDHLRNARRNVVWWGEYFRLNAKYKSRRNLWRITRLAARLGPDPAKALDWVKQQNVISRFSVTLRQALVSVRHGRDLELTPQPDPWYRHALDEMHRAYTWFVVNTFLPLFPR